MNITSERAGAAARPLLDSFGAATQILAQAAMEPRRQQHPYAHFIERVGKPARYLGGEHGEVVKPWDQVQCRACLAFPDLYDVGMSHLGFKILYSILNRHPKLLAERAYAPWVDMEAELRARKEPLRSLESWRPLCDFDVVGFSLQFELTFSNVLLMLDLGGIALRSEERREEDPLVLAGGPTATHPEAIAPFIDGFVIGDGETKTPELLLSWAALKQAGVPRPERLRQLAMLGGLYVPSLYETEVEPETGQQVVSRPRVAGAPLPVERTFVEDLDRHPFPTDGPVANSETVFDRVSVEIARGCTEGCRFCQAGMIYRPVRERSPEQIVEAVSRTVRDGGYDEASLTCLSTADYSAIAPLVRKVGRELKQKKVSLSVSSLRAYGLEGSLLEDLRGVRAAGLTFAPEAGSQRMRDVVNKNVTEEQLLETARRVFGAGWSKMKLYFMLGLPTELDDDVRGIVQTGSRAQQVGRQLQRGLPRVTVSVSTHVPKPHTPFQWCAMDAPDEILRKQALLRQEAKGTKVRLRMHDSKGSWLEGVLARGDRSLAPVVEHAYRHGARFDSWEEQLKLEVWERAFQAVGVSPAKFLGTLPLGVRLPWSHIDVGLEDGFLAREYRKALRDRLSPPCGKAAGMFVHHTNLREAEDDRRRLVCYDCGIACDLTQMRRERMEHLRSLEAFAPVPREEPVDCPREPSPKRRRQPSARFEQGPAFRLRLGYTKLGRAAFVSHLDLIRMLPRVFRRVGLPLYYSQGFHPKPVMTFGPALPVGVSSLAEYVDVKLSMCAPLDLGALLADLKRARVDGIDFFVACQLGSTDPSLSRIVDQAVYVAGLPVKSLSEHGLCPLEALQRRLADRRSPDAARSGSMRVRRNLKGIDRIVDVERYLLAAHAGQGREALDRAGLVGELVPVEVRLRITGQGSVRPKEALEALSGIAELPARWVRVALLGERHGTCHAPSELAALRPHPPPIHSPDQDQSAGYDPAAMAPASMRPETDLLAGLPPNRCSLERGL